MQCILYKIYFWKVFDMYYNLICIFICTPNCTKFYSCKKWVLHIGSIWSRVTCLALPLVASQCLECWAPGGSWSRRRLMIATENKQYKSISTSNTPNSNGFSRGPRPGICLLNGVADGSVCWKRMGRVIRPCGGARKETLTASAGFRSKSR
jgi:hypothetical protein